MYSAFCWLIQMFKKQNKIRTPDFPLQLCCQVDLTIKYLKYKLIHVNILNVVLLIFNNSKITC